MPQISLPPLTNMEQAAIREKAAQLAEALQEMEHGPQAMLYRFVRVVGLEQATALLEETRRIEHAGGMLTADQSRRRTIGGVYFYLARRHLQGHPASAYVFPYMPKARVQKALSSDKVTSVISPQTLLWAQRQVVIDEALGSPGGSQTMKITLIGRPGKIIERGDCIVTALPTMRIPTLPKGVPIPDETTQTQILVYIAKKQWKRVAEALQDPNDVLIVEGFGVFDPRIAGIALLASNVTTKVLQQTKRQAQPAEPNA